MRVTAACVFLFLPLLLEAASPTKSRVHGYALSGTITKVDEQKKTLVVKVNAGKSMTLVWTDATQVFGGKLAAGQTVTLRYLDRDAKHIVTSVRIAPTPAAKAAATPAPTATASR